MPGQVRKGGVWNQLVSGKVFANGAWRDLVAVRVYAGGAWRLVMNFTPPSPPPPSGGGGGTGGGGAITLAATPTTQTIRDSGSSMTATVTATPSGGLVPYTYTWSFVSQDAGVSFAIVSSTHATTDVTVSGVTFGTAASCTLHCVATDSLGATATSNTVSITFRNIGGGA